MHLRTDGLICFFIVLGLGVSAAQAQTPAAPTVPDAATSSPTAPDTPAAKATLYGHIYDPSSALIPGAVVTVFTPTGTTVATTKADADGAYQVNNLAPGSYIVQATSPGFAAFTSQPIQLAAGQVKRLRISMSLAVAQQSVTVTEDSPTVNVDPGGNASAIVIKGADLDALSDDPDELLNELQALAGPAAGPNGGQVYIDGFTGGQLPPKSAIREIRINQNPYSAEYDRLGYGRIEIFTKPGTDKLHGRFFAQGNDDAFNTGNPFVTSMPAYHSYQLNGTVNGPLSKTASYFISIEQRNNQTDSIYSLEQAAVLASNPSQPCGPTTPGSCVLGSISGGLIAPQTHTNISPRIDLQLGKKNTLTVRYQFFRNNQSGSIGSTSLPTLSTTSDSLEHTIQISDSEVISEHMVNETRFQYLRDDATMTPASTAPMISVPGSFSGGGASAQNSSNQTDRLELHNLTTMSVGKQAIKFGTRLRDSHEVSSTSAGFNGSFTFNHVADYVGALNFANDPTFTCSVTTTPLQCGPTNAPSKLNYTTGAPSAKANVFDAALYVQDDWKFNQFLTLSGGMRWESQNHIADHDDWAPRVAFAYALDGHKDKKQAKTVLRAGFGLFYDRFGLGNELSAERFSGGPGTQQQTTINNPSCFNAALLSDINLATCGAAASATSTIVQIAPNYHSPYTEQTGIGLDRQLTKTTTLTMTYLHSYGVHQTVTRDANAYLAGDYIFTTPSTPPTILAPRPLTTSTNNLGIVNQYASEAVFKQNQLIANINAHFTPKFSITGFYDFNAAHSNSGTASNSYDLKQDYGRATFAARNVVFLMSNYTGPLGLSFNATLSAQSGKPFNIVTSNDLTGDNYFNDRPSYATATSNLANVVQTSYGDFNTIPQAGETIIPYNLGTGPAAVAMNLRVGRSFGFGPKLTTPDQNNSGHSGGGGRGAGGGMGGIGRGGMGGGRGGASAAKSGRKYTLNFNAQALNLFNDIDYGTPGGTVGAPNFNKSTSLAGGIFSTPAAARRIFFQAVFSF
jgi:hypothetical protein